MNRKFFCLLIIVPVLASAACEISPSDNCDCNCQTKPEKPGPSFWSKILPVNSQLHPGPGQLRNPNQVTIGGNSVVIKKGKMASQRGFIGR